MNLLAVVAFADYLLQLVLLFLLRGFYRKYAILGAYCVVQLLITSVEGVVFHFQGVDSPLYSRLYWIDEVIIDSFLFLMVIAFTMRALEGNPMQASARKLLRAVGIGALLLPFLVFYRRPLFGPVWFNGTSQFLSFGAAVMNLVLWTALVGNRKRDPRLLTVSAGLGLAVTSAAFYYGIRVFFRGESEQQLMNLFKGSAHVLSVLIWCLAFRPRPKTSTIQPPVTTSRLHS